jgi:hypothetical protein
LCRNPFRIKTSIDDFSGELAGIISSKPGGAVLWILTEEEDVESAIPSATGSSRLLPYVLVALLIRGDTSTACAGDEDMVESAAIEASFPKVMFGTLQDASPEASREKARDMAQGL